VICCSVQVQPRDLRGFLENSLPGFLSDCGSLDWSHVTLFWNGTAAARDSVVPNGSDIPKHMREMWPQSSSKTVFLPTGTVHALQRQRPALPATQLYTPRAAFPVPLRLNPHGLREPTTGDPHVHKPNSNPATPDALEAAWTSQPPTRLSKRPSSPCGRPPCG